MTDFEPMDIDLVIHYCNPPMTFHSIELYDRIHRSLDYYMARWLIQYDEQAGVYTKCEDAQNRHVNGTIDPIF